MGLPQQLSSIIKGEILYDDKTLDEYSHDASIFEIKPQVVVFPKDSEDIKNIVKLAARKKDGGVTITVRSAGTDMSGGPINDSIILDLTKYFNKVINVGEDFAVAQPGVFYRDFEKETLKKNLLLPCYTASREINTVGGMVGNNSAGEKTLSFGQTEEYVRRLKIVLSDGNEYEVIPLNKTQLDKKMKQNDFEGKLYKKIYELIVDNYEELKSAKPKVSKNSAGYYLWNVWDGKTFDLNKVIVGSQGTLGIVTEIEFSLVKPKLHSRMLIIFLHKLDNLGDIINTVLEYSPESFESYDDQTLKVAIRFLPEVIKLMKSDNILGLFIQFLPEVWMAISGGMPKLVLLAEFSGDTGDEVVKKAQKAQEALGKFDISIKMTQSEKEGKKYWTLRRQSFNLLRHHAKHMRTAPFIDDVVVRHESLVEFLPKLREILDKYKKHMIYTIAGHVGNGNFHIIPLMDFYKTETFKIIPELTQKVYNLVFEYKGSMTGEHNDGLIRSPYLKQMYGKKIVELFKEVKNIFDPYNIFNPHKKTDATFDYSLKHVTNPLHQQFHSS